GRRDRVRRCPRTRSRTSLPGRRIAYRTPRGSSSSQSAGVANAASARRTTGWPCVRYPSIMGEYLVPPGRTVDVARPEFGGEAVAVLVEDEERMVADRLEVAVVGRLLLRALGRALGAVEALQAVWPQLRALGASLVALS